MSDIIKFNLKLIWKRNFFLKILVLMPVFAFVFTISSYITQRDLLQIGNPIFSYFFFDASKSSLLNLFLMGLPLLCAIIYGDYHYYEIASIHSIIIRSKKKHQIFISNACFAFLCGFIIVFIFLTFMFLYNFIITNNPTHAVSYNPNFINENYTMVNETAYFSSLFLEQPYLDVCIQTLMLSIYGGFLSLTTYSISLHCDAKIITYLSMMFLTIISMFVIAFLPYIPSNWNIQMVISPQLTMIRHHEIALLLWLSLFIALNAVLLYLKVSKKDGVI